MNYIMNVIQNNEIMFGTFNVDNTHDTSDLNKMK